MDYFFMITYANLRFLKHFFLVITHIVTIRFLNEIGENHALFDLLMYLFRQFRKSIFNSTPFQPFLSLDWMMKSMVNQKKIFSGFSSKAILLRSLRVNVKVQTWQKVAPRNCIQLTRDLLKYSCYLGKMMSNCFNTLLSFPTFNKLVDELKVKRLLGNRFSTSYK